MQTFSLFGVCHVTCSAMWGVSKHFLCSTKHSVKHCHRHCQVLAPLAATHSCRGGFLRVSFKKWQAATAQSVQRFATGSTVRGSNPGGGEPSAFVQTGPGAHTAACAIGTRSFPGVKRPGRGVDHPPPSSAEVKERVELYLYSPSVPS